MQPEKASAADPVIRVLLTTTDFNSRYHQEITVSYDGKEITYTAEEVKKQGDKVRIPAQKDGIRILSIQRQSGTPVYDGSIEIIPKAEGLIIVNELFLEKYLTRVVPSEMPATYEKEALKAQAVAAHTYAERQHLLEQSHPTAELCGADFSNDSSQYQACFTENQARQYYGDNFEASYAKITAAVDEVLPYVLEYDGTPIIAAFCSMSAGTTESAETVWGSKVEYLVPVESEADTSAPRYLETASFTGEEFQAAVQDALPDAVWDTDMAKWVQVGACSQSGTVLEVTVGGKTCSGQELRQMLGLRSAVFSVDVQDGKLVFTTKGYGHGVGMSQYGANAMAKDGADWQEILCHYYPAAQLVQGELPA